ncbi:hypothetical protein Tco_0796626 [Tanacetum coccineum]
MPSLALLWLSMALSKRNDESEIRIELLENEKGLCISQWKYCLELLHEFGLLAAKHVDTPFLENATLTLGKLKKADAVWTNKKQATLSKSSSEAMYISVASATCELIWLGNLFHSLRLKHLYLVELFCDNSSAIQIAANPIFYEKTKHFELGVHFVRENVLGGVVKTVKIHIDLQIADVFTKCLGIAHHKLFCKTLGLHDMFTGVLVRKEKGRMQSRLHKDKVDDL